ncbi:MAG: imidazolonepropionase-like amidohydrolase [Chlamydiales bacterium]|jgi:imidazolonepropionase-like amidohydrolase
MGHLDLSTRAALMVVALAALVAPAAAQSGFVRGGKLFDAVSDELRPNPGIWFEGGKILGLGPRSDEQLEGMPIVDVPDGHTILPGLIDLHAHYAVDLFGEGRVDERVAMPLLFLSNGVTTTYTAGEVDPAEMRSLRSRIDAGELVGPRILNSGPYFGAWRRGWNAEISDEDLVKEISMWAKRGVACFKAKGITPAHLKLLVETAHRHGIGVTGHLDSGFRNSVNTADAIAMGIDRIEHFLGGPMTPPDRSAYASLIEAQPDSDAFRSIAATFIERGTYFDVTLSAFGYVGSRESLVYEQFHDERKYFTAHMRSVLAERPARASMDRYQRIFEAKHALVKAFHDAGGAHLITVGTDHVSWGEFLAPFGIHRELHALVRAGLPPASALKAATINAARALGRGDHFGSVEVGKFADLAIVAGDPTDDITDTRNVWCVLRGGQVHDPDRLRAAAVGRIGPRDAAAESDWQPRSPSKK